MNNLLNSSFFLTFFFLSSCLGQDQKMNKIENIPRETVLSDGESISISNPNGKILIKWKGDTLREFNFNGVNWTEKVIIRKKRWYDCLGVYSPGDKLFTNKGKVRRIVYQEAQRNFTTEEALKNFITQQWNKQNMQLVWNNKGFVGGLAVSPDRYQLNVDLWKITVNGKTPLFFLNNSSAKNKEKGYGIEIRAEGVQKGN